MTEGGLYPRLLPSLKEDYLQQLPPQQKSGKSAGTLKIALHFSQEEKKRK
jgi:hypothetical protein